MTDPHIVVDLDVSGVYAAIERRIELTVQPKPRWMPTWLWHRILARVLVIEYAP